MKLLEQRLLTDHEAAIYLGISPSRLRALRDAGEIKRRRLGRRLLYDRAELDAYIEGLPHEGEESSEEAECDAAFG